MPYKPRNFTSMKKEETFPVFHHKWTDVVPSKIKEENIHMDVYLGIFLKSKEREIKLSVF